MLFVSLATATLFCGMMIFIILTAKALWTEAHPSISVTLIIATVVFGTGFCNQMFIIAKAIVKVIS